MKPNLKLVEARGDDITFTFGRFNPPTVGHEKLIDATNQQLLESIGCMLVRHKTLKRIHLTMKRKLSG